MLPNKLSFSFLLPYLALAQPYDAKHYAKRAITPDNTCGGANGYTCNPNDPFGGSCCSSSGYCGYTAAYCGSGCQRAYGSCFGTSPPATQNGNLWVVPGVGSFTSAETFTFTGTTLPAKLMSSNYIVRDAAHFDHQFESAQVTVSGGYLQLKMPGGQTANPLKSAEVTTTFSNIRYASVRTTAILGNPAGACNGMFFYKSDTQEMDIEFLSDPKSLSNPGDGSRPMQYTNHPNNGGANTHAISPSPSDATTVAHEYRIDWIPGKAMYYLDGVLQKTLTQSVPSTAGTWLWNNWGNNDPGWTGAPPATDNIFKISKIVMYYNTSSV